MRGEQGGSEGGGDDYGMSPHYHRPHGPVYATMGQKSMSVAKSAEGMTILKSAASNLLRSSSRMDEGQAGGF